MTADAANSKYLLDYDAYVKDRPNEVSPAWADYYKEVMTDADARIYTFIMQYIFM
jgi:hypothetical protein